VLRLLCDFEICCGVEILESLHYAADSVVRSFKLKFLHLLDTNSPQEVRLKCGSFLSTDWSDGDVVFANSTCFEDDLVANLAEQAERLKPGALFITFTKALGSDAFEILERKRYRMSKSSCVPTNYCKFILPECRLGPCNSLYTGTQKL
tara:strand:+ start:723 stop:1169 length:447 start_codon:yes stop_codon:yes gene_type:complete